MFKGGLTAVSKLGMSNWWSIACLTLRWTNHEKKSNISTKTLRAVCRSRCSSVYVPCRRCWEGVEATWDGPSFGGGRYLARRCRLGLDFKNLQCEHLCQWKQSDSTAGSWWQCHGLCRQLRDIRHEPHYFAATQLPVLRPYSVASGGGYYPVASVTVVEIDDCEVWNEICK